MTDFVDLLEDQLLAAHAGRPRGVWTRMPSRRAAGALVAGAVAAAAIVAAVLLLASPGGHGDETFRGCAGPLIHRACARPDRRATGDPPGRAGAARGPAGPDDAGISDAAAGDTGAARGDRSGRRDAHDPAPGDAPDGDGAPPPAHRGDGATRHTRPGAADGSAACRGVCVYALRDRALRRRTATPLGSYYVQPAAGRVLTPSLNHGTVTVLDPDGRVVRHVRVAPAAHDACVVR